MEKVTIGFADITHPHVWTRADILQGMEGVVLKSVWEPVDDGGARTFAERYSLKRVSELEDLLGDSEIDAVIIESWTHNMRALTEAALDAGKAVLLEKPASNNAENMAGIVESHRRSGTLLQIGYMMRQSPVVERIRKILAEGILGRTTVSKFHVSVPAPDAVTPWFNLEQDIGGVLFEDGCHMMDIALSLLGMPKRISARIPKYDDLSRKHKHLYEDAAVLTLDWDGMVGSFTCVGWEANEWIETWQMDFYGDAGTLSAGLLPEYFRMYLKEQRGEYGSGWTIVEPTRFPVSWLDLSAQHVWHAVQNRDFFRSELQQFISGVRSGVREIGVTPGDALKVITATEAAYESDRTGKTVALG